MWARRALLLAGCSVVITGCSIIPRTSEEGQIEINKFTDAIQCELAAVARNDQYDALNIPAWGTKSSLDLTVVNTIAADGKVVWTIPYSPAALKLTPSLSGSYKHTSIAHFDFGISIAEALNNPKVARCEPGHDPSETGLGLAAWFEATLMSLRGGNVSHGGMSYTVEFQISSAPGSRFGYKITLIDADVGAGWTYTGTHRLTVAIAPPPGAYKPPKAIPVYIVPDPGAAPIIKFNKVRPGFKRHLFRGRPTAPATDDSTLNRLLLQKAPVRIEGQ